jgi:hypothetical protein
VIFRMRVIDNVKLQAGVGIVRLFNRGEAFNDRFRSSLTSIADFIGLSYNYPLTQKILLGGSLKYTYIFRGEDGYITLQLTSSYRIIDY